MAMTIGIADCTTNPSMSKAIYDAMTSDTILATGIYGAAVVHEADLSATARACLKAQAFGIATGVYNGIHNVATAGGDPVL